MHHSRKSGCQETGQICLIFRPRIKSAALSPTGRPASLCDSYYVTQPRSISGSINLVGVPWFLLDREAVKHHSVNWPEGWLSFWPQSSHRSDCRWKSDCGQQFSCCEASGATDTKSFTVLRCGLWDLAGQGPRLPAELPAASCSGVEVGPGCLHVNVLCVSRPCKGFSTLEFDSHLLADSSLFSTVCLSFPTPCDPGLSFPTPRDPGLSFPTPWDPALSLF